VRRYFFSLRRITLMSDRKRQRKDHHHKSLAGGFVKMPRKAGRRRSKKSPGMGIVGMLALALLVAGFLVRRVMSPIHSHYVPRHAEATPDAPTLPGSPPDAVARGEANSGGKAGAPAPAQQTHNGAAASGEDLTPHDHRALDDIIRERSKQSGR
jgi:hypothetical protein